jgi:hypothetical protein
MQRIKTCFLKKEEIFKGNVTKVMAIELVSNNHDMYYVFENLVDHLTKKYSKTEVGKVWMDYEMASTMYDLSVENKTGSADSGWELAKDGEQITGLSHLLDYTSEYVDSAYQHGRPAERIVFTEQHRRMEV